MIKVFLKIFLWVCCAALIFCGFILIKKGIYAYGKLQEARNLEIYISNLQKENDALRAEIEYFKNPQNLEKEARSVLNYKKSGEKLAIIIDDFKQPTENEKEKMAESGMNFWTQLLFKIKNQILSSFQN